MVSQGAAGRRWWPGARAGLAGTRGCAGDAPCHRAGAAAPPSARTRDHVMAGSLYCRCDRGATASAHASGHSAVPERAEPLASQRSRWGHAPRGAGGLDGPVGALHGGDGRGPRAVGVRWRVSPGQGRGDWRPSHGVPPHLALCCRQGRGGCLCDVRGACRLHGPCSCKADSPRHSHHHTLHGCRAAAIVNTSWARGAALRGRDHGPRGAWEEPEGETRPSPHPER